MTTTQAEPAHHEAVPVPPTRAVDLRAVGRHRWWVLAGLVVLCQAAGLVGVPFTDRTGWYASLDKPWFHPPSPLCQTRSVRL